MITQQPVLHAFTMVAHIIRSQDKSDCQKKKVFFLDMLKTSGAKALQLSQPIYEALLALMDHLKLFSITLLLQTFPLLVVERCLTVG